MVKLFSDEEMLEKCKDYQPIPLALEQKVLHYGGDPDKINILNGVIKSPYKIGQPVNNVTEYAYQLPFQIPIDPEKFLNEYNKVVEKELKKNNLKIISELSRDIIDNVISGLDEIPEAARASPFIGDIESEVGTASTRALPDEQDLEGMDQQRMTIKVKKPRRTQEQMIESKTMATEDINYAEL